MEDPATADRRPDRTFWLHQQPLHPRVTQQDIPLFWFKLVTCPMPWRPFSCLGTTCSSSLLLCPPPIIFLSDVRLLLGISVSANLLSVCFQSPFHPHRNMSEEQIAKKSPPFHCGAFPALYFSAVATCLAFPIRHGHLLWPLSAILPNIIIPFYFRNTSFVWLQPL